MDQKTKTKCNICDLCQKRIKQYLWVSFVVVISLKYLKCISIVPIHFLILWLQIICLAGMTWEGLDYGCYSKMGGFLTVLIKKKAIYKNNGIINIDFIWPNLRHEWEKNKKILFCRHVSSADLYMWVHVLL